MTIDEININYYQMSLLFIVQCSTVLFPSFLSYFFPWRNFPESFNWHLSLSCAMSISFPFQTPSHAKFSSIPSSHLFLGLPRGSWLQSLRYPFKGCSQWVVLFSTHRRVQAALYTLTFDKVSYRQRWVYQDKS